ncbi:MAG: T9SS type A sorting domain-containing protein [Lewinellaceae bacterium]|nr:T9SS type A sorting domain-containing protein [Lewinellaceae bacterium]
MLFWMPPAIHRQSTWQQVIPLLAQPVPGAPLRITGILSRYGTFQLLPRGPLDLVPASCFFFVGAPRQSEITGAGFRLSWETSVPAGGQLFYGPQPDLLDQSIQLPTVSGTHSTVLGNLQPGMVYWIQVQAYTDQDTVYSKIQPFCTRAASSGQIKVFFNQGIDLTAAGGIQPDGNTYEDVLLEMIARINAAQRTIDAAVYNNSRQDLTFALRQAQDRGVQVRYIAAESTANNALKPTAPFPVLYGNSNALMHNKFLVIDADLADQAWVMTGSMNWTNSNMIQDNNNTVFIQDQSLARAYELEFEEMWGSTGPLPQPANSRFGNQKEDNTPHRFVIGDREVECYFSPSDRVTQKIVDAIEDADYQASFAIFSFTKDEIGDAFLSEHNTGTWVRGLVENINDVGAEYEPLLNNGVPVQAHLNFAQLHHKYAVLDAGYPASDPTVVTGSHNWTQSAESSNDENTLIIHDPAIATLFQAEFERRWAEMGTATQELAGVRFEIFPNPTTDHVVVRKNSTGFWSGDYEIYSVSGRLVGSGFYTGAGAVISLSALPQGSYIISLKTAHGIAAFPVQTLRH